MTNQNADSHSSHPPKDSIGYNEAHIWLCFPNQIVNRDLLAEYYHLMSREERERHQRYRFQKDRHTFLVARALLRTILSRYGARGPADWEFVYNEYGRPELVGGQCDLPLFFNLSHTNGLIACAVTHGGDIGVDVENISNEREILNLAEQSLSAMENESFRALPVSKQRDRFLQYWTLKESYMKARGKGMSIPLKHISFKLEDALPIRVSFDDKLEDDPDAWQFRQFYPTNSHILAMCVRLHVGDDLEMRINNHVPLANDGRFRMNGNPVLDSDEKR